MARWIERITIFAIVRRFRTGGDCCVGGCILFGSPAGLAGDKAVHAW
jgi:hypothetical protein